jgi:hypothetical protein
MSEQPAWGPRKGRIGNYALMKRGPVWCVIDLLRGYEVFRHASKTECNAVAEYLAERDTR